MTMCANDGTDLVGLVVAGEVGAAVLEIEELAIAGGPFWVSGVFVGSTWLQAQQAATARAIVVAAARGLRRRPMIGGRSDGVAVNVTSACFLVGSPSESLVAPAPAVPVTIQTARRAKAHRGISAVTPAA
jgi:hypothetical protein